MATLPTKNSSHCRVNQWLDGDRKKEARFKRRLAFAGARLRDEAIEVAGLVVLRKNVDALCHYATSLACVPCPAVVLSISAMTSVANARALSTAPWMLRAWAAPLCVRRAGGEETQLFVKEVMAERRRYIVCRNEAEAAKDAADRAAVIAALDQQLRRGDKALIGNSAYRRFLRLTAKHAFEIDPGKVADEARFDGIFVLRTNPSAGHSTGYRRRNLQASSARITPLQAVLRYRDLIQVEALFKTAKSLMRTRPIYHSSDAAIRGHVFCSFLALILRKELDTRCRRVGLQPEWGDVLRDLDRLQEVEIDKARRRMTLRTPCAGVAGPLFKAARIALPPNIQEASAS